SGGLALLVGFSGGFVWMFPFTALLAGFLTSRVRGHGLVAFILVFLALTLSSALVYVTGVLWYAHLSEISLGKAIAAVVVPFIPGDLIKAFAATAVFMTVRQLNLLPKLTSSRDQVVSLD
ncbi:MAG: biotin transporter BioY, partial [Gorillibacterium sp.]|nr:biotin transporter BioY [Gorillibacterium sp.]